jgi:hypothetical protein
LKEDREKQRKKAKQEPQGTKEGEIKLKWIISATHNTLPQSRIPQGKGDRATNLAAKEGARKNTEKSEAGATRHQRE